VIARQLLACVVLLHSIVNGLRLLQQEISGSPSGLPV
jgi:hypothetical protein